MTETHSAQFTIHAFQLDEVIATLVASNKKARRLHCDVMTLEIERDYEKPRRNRTPLHLLDIKIEGPAPKLAGWTLLAVLEGLGDECLLQCVPGTEIDSKRWGAADPRFCDHCLTTRRRNETFIVRHDDGRELQVGRNCLRDFLGHKDARNVLNLWRALVFGESEEGSFGGYYSRDSGAIEIDELLCLTAVMISLWGWASRGTAQAGGPAATADIVIDYLTGNGRFCTSNSGRGAADANRCAREEIAKVKAAVTSVDRDEVQKAIAWASALTDENSYLLNIGVIARAGHVDKYKQYGFACSILNSYRRTFEREEKKRVEREARPVSHHFGEIKKREVFTLTLKSLIACESDWGDTLLHVFEDADGNVAKWFCSGRSLMVADPQGQFDIKGEQYEWIDGKRVDLSGYRPATEGDTLRVKATVKAHDEYKGSKQTLLTRVLAA